MNLKVFVLVLLLVSQVLACSCFNCYGICIAGVCIGGCPTEASRALELSADVVQVNYNVTTSCGWSCAIEIATLVPKCGTLVTCYIQNLGNLCGDCCSCIPVIGKEVCKLCPTAQDLKPPKLSTSFSQCN